VKEMTILSSLIGDISVLIKRAMLTLKIRILEAGVPQRNVSGRITWELGHKCCPCF
jgi:hypothetical protein